jgi:deoxycytidylate deaminase
MKYLSGGEKEEALVYLARAAELARQSTCQRRRCGSIIVNYERIIGKGYNSPPRNLESQRRCSDDKTRYNRKVVDKTCCIHAEQRAILNAVRFNLEKVVGSRLYFIEVDSVGDSQRAGKPYCTACSKLALDEGVKEIVLWHKEGVCAYLSEEYNDLSFNYSPPEQSL